jgi:hypothetical protein
MMMMMTVVVVMVMMLLMMMMMMMTIPMTKEETVTRTVHRLHTPLLLLDIEHEHVLLVVLRVS